MVAGLKFLSKKSFNPQNLTNQKSVFLAEQESQREANRQRERERQLAVERDHEELARSRNGTKGGQKAVLSFMYDAPPGLGDKNKQEGYDGYDDGGDEDWANKASGQPQNQNQKDISFERKSGDDDAAAAFRQMLANQHIETQQNDPSNLHDHDPNENADKNEQNDTDFEPSSSSLIISGSNTEANKADKSLLTQLERAVGKRNASSVTYQEQIARFPQLQNAPVALKRKRDGEEEVTTTNLNFKPLGAQIRNVRCLTCKIWGHSKGDRECKLSGWDPFSAAGSAARSASAAAAMAMNGGRGPAGKSSIMVDRTERDERYNYYGPGSGSGPGPASGPSKDIHKRKDDDDVDGSDSDDDSKRERKRKRKKKSKRHKESRRDREDRKRRRRKHSRRDHDDDEDGGGGDGGGDGDKSRDYNYDSYSSDESYSRRRRRDRRSRRHTSRRRSRSRSRSPYSSSP